MTKLYSAFKPNIYKCKKCRAPYSHEKTSLRCCSKLAKIDKTKIVEPILKIKQTKEEKKVVRKIYYETYKDIILLKQRKYDAKKKENQSIRKKG